MSTSERPLVSKAASALSDQLQRILDSQTGHCWLLLDPTLRPFEGASPLADWLVGKEPVFVPSSGEPTQKFMPFLVDVNCLRAEDSFAIGQGFHEALEELDPASLAGGRGRRICGWLESRHPAKVVARHISEQMVQRLPSGQHRLLRWHDPAVIWGIWPVLDRRQRHCLLGPIQHFHLIDPLGNLTSRSTEVSEAWSPRKNDKLDFDGPQWQRIKHAGYFNTLLRTLPRPQTPEALENIRATAMAAFARGAAHGFDDSADLVAFSRYAVTVSPEFDSHPIIVERLNGKSASDYFTALIDDITPEQWQMIRTSNT